MKEKGIIAYFRTEKGAQKAVRELKERGFETVRMDHFPNSREKMWPIWIIPSPNRPLPWQV